MTDCVHSMRTSDLPLREVCVKNADFGANAAQMLFDKPSPAWNIDINTPKKAPLATLLISACARGDLGRTIIMIQSFFPDNIDINGLAIPSR